MEGLLLFALQHVSQAGYLIRSPIRLVFETPNGMNAQLEWLCNAHYRFIVCTVSVRLKLVKALKHPRLGSFTNLFRTETLAKMVWPEVLQAAGGMMACMTNKEGGHLCPHLRVSGRVRHYCPLGVPKTVLP